MQVPPEVWRQVGGETVICLSLVCRAVFSVLLFTILVACIACEPRKGTTGSGPARPAAVVDPAFFEVRLAADPTTQGWVDTTDWVEMKTRPGFYMQPSALVAANHLRTAEFTGGTGGTRWLAVSFTKEGARIFKKALKGWGGNHLVALTSGIEIMCSRVQLSEPADNLYFQPEGGAQVEASLKKLVDSMQEK